MSFPTITSSPRAHRLLLGGPLGDLFLKFLLGNSLIAGSHFLFLACTCCCAQAAPNYYALSDHRGLVNRDRHPHHIDFDLSRCCWTWRAAGALCTSTRCAGKSSSPPASTPSASCRRALPSPCCGFLQRLWPQVKHPGLCRHALRHPGSFLPI